MTDDVTQAIVATDGELQTRPEPLVTVSVNFRKVGKPFMPLFGDILQSSVGWNRAPLEVRGAMIQLWWHAWSKQSPMGSLPNDDEALLVASGLGQRPDLWEANKRLILRNFIVCSDGRLYHKFLCATINEMLSTRALVADRVRKSRSDTKGDVTAPKAVKRDNREEKKREDKKENLPSEGMSPAQGNVIDLAPLKQESTGDVRLAVDAYNEVAREVGWPLCQTLSEARKTAIRHRLTEAGGLEGWKIAMEKARASPFLTGKTRRSGDHSNWTCSIDFLIKPANFAKLMEGNYDDRQGQNQSSGYADGGVNPNGATQRALRGLLAADLRPGGSGRDGAD